MKKLQPYLTNTLDSPEVSKLKNSLREYSKIVTDTSIFNHNNNTEDIENLIFNVLEDLYITEPKEVLDFTNYQPSKSLIENIFKQYGIDDKILNKYPEILKPKTAYLFEQLFESKGSNKTFELFNQIIQEFYHNLNFYNVQIEQREIISKYSTPVPSLVLYTKPNGELLDQYTTETIDNNIGFKIYTSLDSKYHKVTYHIKFFDPLLNDLSFKLNFTNKYKIPRDSTEFKITESKYDIYALGERSAEQLVYKLNPVLINDPLRIIETISPSELRTNKFVMQKIDFFNQDKKNASPPNVSPIKTNILFIQFNNSDTTDTMEYLPDLIRIFAMTKTQNEKFTFKINNLKIKVSLSELINILNFIKMCELNKKTNYVFKTEESIFYKYIYPLNELENIYKLLLFYKDMKHDYETFNNFKKQYFKLINNSSQFTSDQYITFDQFKKYLTGNIPTVFSDFWIMVESLYKDGEVIYNGYDQNKLFKEKLHIMHDTLNPTDPTDLIRLIELQDTKIDGLNDTVYDIIKSQFIDKYPRVIQAIESITSEEVFLELYTTSYKILLSEVTKMDNFITYFVNDIFKLYLSGSSFKNHFFNPVFDMFQKYFFKAELSYQNSDNILYTINDKMQQVVCGSKNSIAVTSSGKYSEINLLDDQNIRNEITKKETLHLSDNWSVQIINNSGVVNTSSESDAAYGTPV